MLLITDHPRAVSGAHAVKVSRLSDDRRHLTHLAIYLPAHAAHAVGVGSKLANYEVRVGDRTTAEQDFAT